MKRWRTVINQTIIVIGGGAAGLMAAGVAAQTGAKVFIFDKNEKLARKLRITGKGRCNVTNHCTPAQMIAAVPGNGKFLYGALHAFGPTDTMDFFESLGVPLKIERGNRVFPVSNDANQVADALGKFALDAGVTLLRQSVESVIEVAGAVRGVRAGGKEYLAEKVLIATGGASYRATGSTGDGYRFAKALGHTVTPLRPSLVALCSDSPDCAEMQGLALKNCALRLVEAQSEKCVYEDFGELLFTHFGVSGPMVLSASAHMRSDKKYNIVLDLKPALSPEQLDARLLRDFAKNNKNFENILGGLLPSSMIPVMLRRCAVSGEMKGHSITREQRHMLLHACKAFSVPITGFRPINEAIITAGGVSVKEINPKTMASKLVKGLYFAGEVIDVDAYTGGHNLQIAFATGQLAGKAMGED